jgi:hypothetical protein
MNLKIDSGSLVYRQFGRDVKLPIANMTKKVYDYNNKQVFIYTVLNTKLRQFIFKFSEIVIPKFINFDDMVLWFDMNVVLVTASPTPPASVGNIRRSETFYAPSYISYLGFAPDGSAESDAVWTITKRVGSADGTIISNVQSFNKKWTERGLL